MCCLLVAMEPHCRDCGSRSRRRGVPGRPGPAPRRPAPSPPMHRGPERMWWSWYSSERLRMPGKICRGLGASRHFELGEDARHVVLDGLLGELQVGADLPVRLTVRDLAKDPLLLSRKPSKPLVPEQVLALAKAVENAFGHDRIEEVLTGANRANGPHQIAPFTCFRTYPAAPAMIEANRASSSANVVSIST